MSKSLSLARTATDALGIATDTINALNARVDALLIANSRETERRRKADRLHREAATTVTLYSEKFNDIADLVSLRNGDCIKWTEPDEVTDRIAETLDHYKQALEIIREIVSTDEAAIEEMNVLGVPPMAETTELTKRAKAILEAVPEWAR